jgi:hypothetical protein
MRPTLAVLCAVAVFAGACDRADPAAEEGAAPEAPAPQEPADGDDDEEATDDPPAAPVDDEEADDADAAEDDPPVAASDPAGLAEQITTVEQAIRSDRPLEDVGAEAHLQQVAYRRASLEPAWREEILANVPEELHGTVSANIDAGIGLARLTEPQAELPEWQIIDAPPADELLGYYREAEAAYGVGWEYLAAIHLAETRMGRIRGTSPAGAQGPMQFMPGTWEAYGEGDVNDPRDAILAAARYLAASGAPEDMDSALFSYNRSDAYVTALQAYAGQMQDDLRAFHGYYHWQVYYVTTEGDRLLPIGYDGSS